MKRGGDTPGTQTLIAIKAYNVDKYTTFYIQNGVLYANTDEGSSAIWEVDSDGVVVDNISIPINQRSSILAKINEHYGTSFTGWSDNEIGLHVGDSLPNWSAYEKITL